MKENAWNKYNEKDLEELETICNDYKYYLTKCKTEREATKEIIHRAKNSGFKNLEEFIKDNTNIKAGDKIYVNNHDKAVALFVIGEEDITKGMNILGAHIDSPRLDLKAMPLYEDSWN